MVILWQPKGLGVTVTNAVMDDSTDTLGWHTISVRD